VSRHQHSASTAPVLIVPDSTSNCVRGGTGELRCTSPVTPVQVLK
jgi:hypothetical protein